ncbi:MAG: hypothetical protein WDM88_07425 [Galbitalea sp.]
MANEYRGVEVFGRGGRRRAPTPPLRRVRLGLLSLGAALVTVVITGVGIGTAMAGDYEAAILLAYLATGTSVVAVLCGAAAVVTARGRTWGAAAVVVGILASPPVLTRLLGWASGLG